MVLMTDVVLVPCESRILQSPTKGQVKLVLWERPSGDLQWGGTSLKGLFSVSTSYSFQ